MNVPVTSNLTLLIRAAANGDRQAKKATVDLVYEQLRQIAYRLMRMENNQTLQATALVHEAYFRLMDKEEIANSSNRAYFFAAAAQAMRRILVDSARRRQSAKRGGHYQRQPFDEMLEVYEQKNIELLALDEALDELEALHSQQAQIVNMRWFGEQSVNQVAELLEISISTVEREWRTAKAFLYMRLSNTD